MTKLEKAVCKLNEAIHEILEADRPTNQIGSVTDVIKREIDYDTRYSLYLIACGSTAAMMDSLLTDRTERTDRQADLGKLG